jgi:hypothetical protein
MAGPSSSEMERRNMVEARRLCEGGLRDYEKRDDRWKFGSTMLSAVFRRPTLTEAKVGKG